MRADHANSSDDENAQREVSEGEVTRSWGAQLTEALRRVVCASGRSRCGEEIDLPHPPTASIRERRFEARSPKAWARGGEQH
jgi:hypothetical protein